MSLDMKPIAVITHRLSTAIDFLRDTREVREINGAKRRVVDNDGQVYDIVFDVNHPKGMEYSKVITAPLAFRNPNYMELCDAVQLRMR